MILPKISGRIQKNRKTTLISTKKNKQRLRNLKLVIEYEGTNYCGWQIQNKQRGKRSIQEVIQRTISKVIGKHVSLTGSGRTDSGAHAKGQVANFKTGSKIPASKLQLALNALLPKDIAVTKIEEVPSDFHSRFWAKSKIYRYSILNRNYPSVFLRKSAYFCRYPLDIKLMKKEARVLLGRHDFKSFQAKEKKERGSVRTIKSVIIKKNNGLLHIEIEADGFLYNMVRNIAGTLLEVARGRFAAGKVRQILYAKDRKFAGPTLPAYGLTLLKVKY